MVEKLKMISLPKLEKKEKVISLPNYRLSKYSRKEKKNKKN